MGNDENIAHVREGKPHLLEEHLRLVGDLSGEFAAVFGNQDWGQLAGIWHDLGKYKADFQEWGQCVPELYDNVFGLRLEGPAFQGDEFIC